MTTTADAFAQGWQCQQSGDLPQAERIYRQILESEPDNARVWFVLGTALHAQKRHADAEPAFRRAIELRPLEADGHYYLGNVLLEQQKLTDAANAFRECLRLKPDHAESLTNLGYVLGDEGKHDEAMACYQKAIQLKPDSAELHHNVGNMHREKEELDKAVGCYRRALELKPDYSKAHINMGIALVAKGDLENAVAAIKHGLSFQPDFVEGYNTLGAAVSTQGKLDEAIECYRHALRLQPDCAEAHWNMSLALLLQGKFEEGWSEYVWRWKCKKNIPMPPFTEPLWNGEPVTGKTVVLHAEQGLGDTIHFVRYVPIVRQMGATVIVHCQEPLNKLLLRCPGINGIANSGAKLPHFDYHAPLLNLPVILKTRLDSIPGTVPYLFADPVLIEHWRRELYPIRGLRIGIAWQGNPKHPWDRHRSVPLAHFESLDRIQGVHLISLQKGHGSEQLAAVKDRFPVISLGEQLDVLSGPFMDTSAVLKNLDLVIASDTAVAHLAGALGVPTWLALSSTPDWRWLIDRDDSPWYPTMRLFRQQQLGDWQAVFARMAEELKKLVSIKIQPDPILVEVAPGELIDKITILEIKSERITEPAKLQNVRAELAVLSAVRDRIVAGHAVVAEMAGKLKEVNTKLWEIEDAIRACERDRKFGKAFVALARSVYQQNDQRASLKRQINEALGSRLIEEKSYAEYRKGTP